MLPTRQKAEGPFWQEDVCFVRGGNRAGSQSGRAGFVSCNLPVGMALLVVPFSLPNEIPGVVLVAFTVAPLAPAMVFTKVLARAMVEALAEALPEAFAEANEKAFDEVLIVFLLNFGAIVTCSAMVFTALGE